MDLYYLMDLSKSMEDDKEKLSALGDLLAETMQNITSNFRLEFTTNSWLLQSVNKGTVDVFIVNLHLKSFTSDSQWFPLNHFKQKLLIELLLKFCNFIIFNCFIFINFEPRDLLMI